MFTKVIAGWNGSPESESAAEWAAAHCSALPLTLIHAAKRMRAWRGSHMSVSGDSEEQESLRNVAERLHSLYPQLRVDTEIAYGHVVEVLSDRLAADALVAVGGPVHQTSRWTVGARLAGRPGGGQVAVIPAVRPAARGPAVVVGVDGSEASFSAIEIGAAEAERLDAPLELVHAWRASVEWDTSLLEYPSDVDTLEEIHRGILDDAVAFAHSIGAHPSSWLEAGSAVEVLRRVGWMSALVVVASHGRRATSRFFLGSVSHDLVADPPAPVLVVSPPR